ncbi:unnamed protein product [Rhizopus stolonifer]
MLRKYRKAVEEYSDDDIMSNDSLSKRPKFGQKRSKKIIQREYKFTVDSDQPTDLELIGITLKQLTSSKYVDLDSQWVDDVDIDSGEIPTEQTVDQREWNDWHILKEKLVKTYLRSLEQSKPRMSCTSLAKQEACKECPTMQTSNVVVYYTDLHVAEHIQHCKHLSLPEAMMSLHVFPASTKNPRQGFHFGLLDFVYLTKMIGYMSNHSWAKVLNKNNGQMPGFVPVTKKSLNKAYMLYRRLTMYAKSFVRERHGIKEATCAVCEDAQKNYVTMDGNFQLKRYKGVANKPNGQKLLGLYDEEAEGKLWGSHEEVEAQSSHAIQKDCDLEALENDFKAVSARHSKNAVFDENGVFAVGCARHGIPTQFYDIKVGEGHKYALAAVGSELAKTNNNEMYVMYDIACFLAKKLESVYPDTQFHSFVHQMHCQVKYNPRYISGFALTDGEGMERLWSYLSGFISMTRGMTKVNRRLLLSEAVAFYTEEKMETMARFIAQKMDAAKKILGEANRGLVGKDVVQIEANWKAMVAGIEEAKMANRNLFLALEEELSSKYLLHMEEEYIYRLNVFFLNRNSSDFEGRKEIEEKVDLFEKKYPGIERRCVGIPDPSSNAISWFRGQMVTKVKNLIRSAVTSIKFLNKEISRRNARASGLKTAERLMAARALQYKKAGPLVKQFNEFVEKYDNSLRLPGLDVLTRKKQDLSMLMVSGVNEQLDSATVHWHLKSRALEEMELLESEANHFHSNLLAQEKHLTAVLGKGPAEFWDGEMAEIERERVRVRQMIDGSSAQLRGLLNIAVDSLDAEIQGQEVEETLDEEDEEDEEAEAEDDDVVIVSYVSDEESNDQEIN